MFDSKFAQGCAELVRCETRTVIGKDDSGDAVLREHVFDEFTQNCRRSLIGNSDSDHPFGKVVLDDEDVLIPSVRYSSGTRSHDIHADHVERRDDPYWFQRNLGVWTDLIQLARGAGIHKVFCVCDHRGPIVFSTHLSQHRV